VNVSRSLAGAVARTAALAALAVCFAASNAGAQGLTVLPVNINMPAGQMAAVLTVQNQGDAPVSFQLRAFAWNQQSGADQLLPTDALVASPPLGTIAPGGSQVVRLVLRRAAEGPEGTYRILLDQIPPPASPGTVRVALRLSIPVFAEPADRATPRLQWHIENSGGQPYLVAVNDGSRHEKVSDITLAASGGGSLSVESNVSPYILAGATRRWRILTPRLSSAGDTLRLTARADAGAIDQAVPVARAGR
jgi:fimbrial chaperone protein